jgi:RNA polymerase sigma-70 factor (ECF subfamily)
VEPDDDLLSRSAREPEAFEPLVAKYSAKLNAYLVRRAPAAADDLLAEVWMRAFARRGTFEASRGTAQMWLFTIARNVVATHWQTVAKGKVERAGDDVASDPWQAVDQRLDAWAVGARLRQGLAELPEVERELLLLVVWEELSPSEAAHVVGIPTGTARSRLHRARGRMRDLLEESARVAPVPLKAGSARGELT